MLCNHDTKSINKNSKKKNENKLIKGTETKKPHQCDWVCTQSGTFTPEMNMSKEDLLVLPVPQGPVSYVTALAITQRPH